MDYQIVDDANFRVFEQFTDPSTGGLKTTGTIVLRIFEMDVATPAIGIYEWDSGNEAFVTSSVVDDEGTLTHHQASGIDTGLWFSPSIVYTAFTAGTKYVFQFANETDTVYQAYQVTYKGVGMWVNVEQIDGGATAAANLKTAGDNYSATRGFAGTALPAAAADAAGGLPISDAGGLDLDAILSNAYNAFLQAGTAASNSGTLLTDLQDGGRLDLLIDAIKAVTDTYSGKAPSGTIADSSEVTAIQNNTRVVRVVPATMERPDSGSTTFRIELLLYDDAGNMEAPDSAPTIGVVNQSGTSRSSNLDSATMSLISTGRYRSTYTLSSGDAIEQLVFEFAVTEGSATRQYGNTAQVVDTTAVDFTSADRAKLDELHDNRLTEARADALDNLDATVSSRNATTPPSAAAVADAVLDEALSGHTTAGTLGKAIADVLAETQVEGIYLQTEGGHQVSVRTRGSTANDSPVELFKLDLYDASGNPITDPTTPVATMRGEASS